MEAVRRALWPVAQPFRTSPELLGLTSRLDPLRTLQEVRTCIAKHANVVPNEFRDQVDGYLSEAEAFGYLEDLPRTIVHSDVTWGNVVRTRAGLTMVDLEGAGLAPAVMDLVEVTTKLCMGPSGSGPLSQEATYAFYEGYGTVRILSGFEIESLPEVHLFHQLYFLANSLERGDFDFISRMGVRLANWQDGTFETLANVASR